MTDGEEKSATIVKYIGKYPTPCELITWPTIIYLKESSEMRLITLYD